MKLVFRRVITRLIVAGGCAWMATAQAVGLGGLTVQSALGQPLAAEIGVTSLEAAEFAWVVARVASPEQYETAKIAYSPLLRQLRITAERRADGKTILKISSFAPINEPTLDLLVDFNWRGGRLLQKYSVLLDPPK